jgi:hypothetical protein
MRRATRRDMPHVAAISTPGKQKPSINTPRIRDSGDPARNLPSGRAKGVTVSHRMIELLIGRLITDEGFRADFLRDPARTLQDLRDQGLDLSTTEVAALVSTDPLLWTRIADRIDPRLQKASLRDEVLS